MKVNVRMTSLIGKLLLVFVQLRIVGTVQFFRRLILALSHLSTVELLESMDERAL